MALQNETYYSTWIDIEIPEPDFILPSSLTTIGEEAFSNNSFTFVSVPTTTTSIASKAFANCPELRHILILSDEISIAKDAFDGVTGLTIHCHEDSDAYWYAKRYGFSIEIE